MNIYRIIKIEANVYTGLGGDSYTKSVYKLRLSYNAPRDAQGFGSEESQLKQSRIRRERLMSES